MKNIFKSISLIFVISIMFSGCFSPSKVDAGEEAVLVKKPWFFGHGGVDEEPIKTGLVWTAWSTEVVRVDVKPFNITEPFDDLITYDNNPVDFDIHLTFKHIEGKTPILVEKFGMSVIDENRFSTGGWYGSKVKEPLRNAVREFTKGNTMFEMTTDPNVVIKLENIVNTEIKKFLQNEGIPTELVNATVGKVTPPKAVIDSTIQTAVQKQNVKTQEERVKAEQSRELAEKASANADKAYMKAIDMNAEQYLKMKELDNQKLAIERGSNVNIIMGNGIPIIQTNK